METIRPARLSKPTILKKCGCGCEYTLAQWNALPYVGMLDIYEDDDQAGELRNCTCGSTITVEVKDKK